MNEKNSSHSFILGFLIGAVLVFLTATKTGKKFAKIATGNLESFLDQIAKEFESAEAEFGQAEPEPETENFPQIEKIQNQGRRIVKKFFHRRLKPD